jgi:hypothetical protein
VLLLEMVMLLGITVVWQLVRKLFQGYGESEQGSDACHTVCKEQDLQQQP